MMELTHFLHYYHHPTKYDIFVSVLHNSNFLFITIRDVPRFAQEGGGGALRTGEGED